jgi:hypothetical protein
VDLVVFENNKPYVLDEFRQGRFDYIELASDVAETKLFRFLFEKDIVARLAAEYPTPRERLHVPLWMHVSSQMSMRLHGAPAAAGGAATRPSSSSTATRRASASSSPACASSTPTRPRPPPGGPSSKASSRPQALRQREQRRQKTLARRRAKARRDASPDPSKGLLRTLITALPDLTTWDDCPVPLTGVLSRDLYADGHEESWMLVTTARAWSARHTRELYRLRTDIEERHRQVKCFWDLTRFHSTAWSLVVNQTVFVALTYSLLQLRLLATGHQELNRRTWPTAHRLLPDGDRGILYRQQYFAFLTLLEHTPLTLSLEGKARRRAYAKARRLLNGDLPT